MKSCFLKRSAGVLLPIFSLPSPFGIGTFGTSAYEWIDFLKKCGQSYWQVLPLGPTGYGDSPYQSFSAFAGNPYFIDFELLYKDGLLLKKEYESIDWGSGSVDYNIIFANKEKVLRKAYKRFGEKDLLNKFYEDNIEWLDDYAIFTAIKANFDLKPWWEWDDEAKLREPMTIKKLRYELDDDINYNIFIQYIFFKQWFQLKNYANSKEIEIIGDMPIYVSMDSADVWSNHEMFFIDDEMKPISVAGVPPDGFSDKGQHWGNPLYRWEVMKKDNYKWFINRLKFNLNIFDVLRIDHFRGFESYYSIPYGETTAKNGQWNKGPGIEFIDFINESLGDGAKIIAEDLGYLTDEVKELLDKSGYPGMKILQFAFDSREESDYLPHNYYKHCVVYTGTHDNDTIKGWVNGALKNDISFAKEYLDVRDHEETNWHFIRSALGSVAALVIIPIQDYLNIGSEGRINTPSTLGGNNWKWRLDYDLLTDDIINKIARLTKIYGRV